MNTSDLALFVQTADSGSITRAAQQLDLTTATASAAIKRLEKQLGTALFIRSTRQLRLSAEGERFLMYCRKALANLDEGFNAINALEGKVAGELRISVPSDLGRNLFLSWMDEIMEAHPDLSISLVIGDSLADFYQDRIDLAIRYGQLQDSNMVAFKLANIDRILCAAPSYVARFGMPTHPNELLQHNCLLFEVNERRFDLWELHQDVGGRVERFKVKVMGNRSANDADVVHRWAVSGKGIAFKARLDMLSDLRDGKVVRLLSNYYAPAVDLHLMSPSRKQVTPAVLLLRDILREKFRQLLG
ncbi:LysR family transcriptional regulator [Paraferrimonas haliotis]|uniref:LysR family transcriptional regulator n=1 Tax=Paraferrimonas haliotis TaxID=2013866 RepID=A0AA37WYX0_9GAMM|nr:LysR family transcriptional regulator [Paraferrimonas haliotis]GLS84260.1 LysR family transcriptional regulator [Paraferrimonas haliotis]